jgi:hypothetical protein
MIKKYTITQTCNSLECVSNSAYICSFCGKETYATHTVPARVKHKYSTIEVLSKFYSINNGCRFVFEDDTPEILSKMEDYNKI